MKAKRPVLQGTGRARGTTLVLPLNYVEGWRLKVKGSSLTSITVTPTRFREQLRGGIPFIAWYVLGILA